MPQLQGAANRGGTAESYPFVLNVDGRVFYLEVIMPRTIREYTINDIKEIISGQDDVDADKVLYNFTDQYNHDGSPKIVSTDEVIFVSVLD